MPTPRNVSIETVYQPRFFFGGLDGNPAPSPREPVYNPAQAAEPLISEWVGPLSTPQAAGRAAAAAPPPPLPPGGADWYPAAPPNLAERPLPVVEPKNLRSLAC